MLKVVMNGAVDLLSTVPDLDEAMTILFLALNNPNVSGHVRKRWLRSGHIFL